MAGKRATTPLASARKATGLRLRDLAERCACSVMYVSDIERGNRCGEGVFLCLAHELGLSDRAIDLHFYQWGRISPDLRNVGDWGHVESCLDDFRKAILS